MVRIRGSHRQYRHPDKPGTVTIAGKPGDDLPRGIMGERHEAGRAEGVKQEMRYTIVIERAPRNYAAYVPDLPGCVATGDTLHPTVKPAALVADAIQDVTRRGELVLDSFLGSGTTLIAAERTGRRFRGLDIDPAYVDVALERWSQTTGGAPRLDRKGPNE